jgi:hypothetical protein
MPRPVSWIPRLHEIRKAVGSSVRSHYERREIETLFQVQARTAQQLLEMLPTTVIGRARLVERQALAAFLDRLHEAEEPSAELEQIRRKGGTTIRKKIRTLIPRDTELLSVHSLPSNVEIERGRLTISFSKLEELAEAMYLVARVIEAEGDSLSEQFEVRPNPAIDAAEAEMIDMMRELEVLEKNWAEKCSLDAVPTPLPSQEVLEVPRDR